MRLRERRPELGRAVATAVVVAGVTLVPAGLAAAQTDAGDDRTRTAADTAPCAVVFVPPIVAGSDRDVVYADLLGEIGRTTEVVPEPGSGLAVRLVLRGEDDDEPGTPVPGGREARGEAGAEGEAMAGDSAFEPAAAVKDTPPAARNDPPEPSRPRAFDYKVVLDASEAREGRWGITFDGTDGVCPGEIVVRRSSAATRPGDRRKDPGSDV